MVKLVKDKAELSRPTTFSWIMFFYSVKYQWFMHFFVTILVLDKGCQQKYNIFYCFLLEPSLQLFTELWMQAKGETLNWEPTSLKDLVRVRRQSYLSKRPKPCIVHCRKKKSLKSVWRCNIYLANTRRQPSTQGRRKLVREGGRSLLKYL